MEGLQDPIETKLMENDLKSASKRIITNTLTTTILGALAGSSIGVYRNIPAIPAAFKTGINTGVFSFSFFSIREYAINPLLLHLPFRTTTSSPRTENLLSTSLASFTTGTLFSFYTRTGTHTFAHQLKLAARGGFTLALFCTAVQAGVNELGMMRIKAIAWGEERDKILAGNEASSAGEGEGEVKEAPPSYTRSISSPKPSVPSRETFSERSDRLIGSAFDSFKTGLGRLSPVKKMEEGDYERLLREKLAAVESEREQVRREREELEARLR